MNVNPLFIHIAAILMALHPNFCVASFSFSLKILYISCGVEMLVMNASGHRLSENVLIYIIRLDFYQSENSYDLLG
jgi:hypothetical protein